MSNVEKNSEQQESIEVGEQVVQSSLDSLFKERDAIKDSTAHVEEKPEVSKKVKAEKPSKEEKVVASKEKPIENSKNKPKEDEDDEEDEKEEDVREKEIGRLKKALNDSQKWGHSNSKKLKSAIKMIGALKEEGVLTEDDFTNLNNLLHSDSVDEEQEAVVSDNPLVNLIKIADKRIPDLEEIFEDDTFFRKKIASFNFFIQHASERELEDVLEELEELKENPLKLAKKMYHIGEKFYNDTYKGLDEAGGLKGFIESKNLELEKLQKKIDKLEKKLLQFNDYDKPNFKIDELVDADNVSTNRPKDTLGQAFEEREASYKRSRGY